MTENEVVEKCTKALLRHQQQPEHIWREATKSLNFARQMVVCLKELGLLTLESK